MIEFDPFKLVDQARSAASAEEQARKEKVETYFNGIMKVFSHQKMTDKISKTGECTILLIFGSGQYFSQISVIPDLEHKFDNLYVTKQELMDLYEKFKTEFAPSQVHCCPSYERSTDRTTAIHIRIYTVAGRYLQFTWNNTGISSKHYEGYDKLIHGDSTTITGMELAQAEKAYLESKSNPDKVERAFNGIFGQSWKVVSENILKKVSIEYRITLNGVSNLQLPGITPNVFQQQQYTDRGPYTTLEIVDIINRICQLCLKRGYVFIGAFADSRINDNGYDIACLSQSVSRLKHETTLVPILSILVPAKESTPLPLAPKKVELDLFACTTKEKN